MSAQPARDIKAVNAYTNEAGEPRCVVILASGEKVPLASLSRVEAIKAAKIAFPEVSGKAWFTQSSDIITTAIRTKTLPDGFDTSGKLGAKATSKPTTPKPTVLRATAKATKAVAHREAGDGAEALAEAIRNLVPQSATVDEDQVRRIVTEAIEASPVRRVEVVLPDRTVPLPEQAHRVLPEVVQILATGLNLFLVGPAGSGKSTLAHQAAEALGLDFKALSLGPTTPTSKLFGYQDAQGRYVRTPFRDAYENGGVILLDELDNGHPGLVAEINQATANGYAAFADGMVKRHADCRIVATGNTFGRGPDRLFVGRNILDAATLDRFVTVEVEVDETLERNIALGYATDATKATITAHVERVQATRRKVDEAKVPLVVSPRASIEGALLIASGLDPERVAEIRLYAGWTTEQRSKVGV